MYIQRVAPVNEELKRGSVLLLGPRRTGKSALIREEVRADAVYNLLKSDVFQRLSARPSLIREESAGKRLIVIDEIQKLPDLLDEVHLMMEEHGARFLLTGSSARKLRRGSGSLLAGRARPLRMAPFCFPEIPEFDLGRRLQFGSLPPVWLSEQPADELAGYSGTYLLEEVQAEALARKIEGFSRFLSTAALSNTLLVNFEAVASDAQVPARTVREYYAVLQDTLMGVLLEPFHPRPRGAVRVSRKPVSKAKFYFFDTGVAHALIGQRDLADGTDAFGRAFEHFVYQELAAYQAYRKRSGRLQFWRTQLGAEVDFVLDGVVAVEAKSTTMVSERHLRGLALLGEETPLARRIVVSRDPKRRRMGTVEVLPYRPFLEELWGGKLWP